MMELSNGTAAVRLTGLGLMTLLVLLPPGRSDAAEQSYDQWFAKLDATHRVYADVLKQAIRKKVADAQPTDPRKHTYGDPEVLASLQGRARQAIEANNEAAAIEAWVELFRHTNPNWAHTAGFAASPAVQVEVARFWLPINKVSRDQHPVGTFNYRLMNAAVQATQRMIDTKP